ncbi:MAG: transcription-repair coupling factor, partial [Alphaproteobacteria bacterium CG_4_10_14_0_8_um_filter_53_9]
GAAGDTGIIVVVPKGVSLTGMGGELGVLLGEGADVLVYPEWDVQPYERVAPSTACVGERMAVWAKLCPPRGRKDGVTEAEEVAEPKPVVIVTSEAALRQRVCWPVDEAGAPLRCLEISAGAVLRPEEAARHLVSLGYDRVEVVQAVGQFAMRGGLMDVWAGGEEAPVRVEWFDDEIERLRPFDAASQRLEGADTDVRGIWVPPVIEAGLTEETTARFRQAYRDRVDGDVSEDEIYADVSEGRFPSGGVQWGALFTGAAGQGLLEGLKHTEGVWRMVRAVGLAEDGMPWPEEAGQVLKAAEMLVTADEFKTYMARLSLLEVDEGGVSALPFRPHDFRGRELTGAWNVHKAVVHAVEDIEAWRADGWSVVVTAMTLPGLTQMLRALEGEGFNGAQPVEAFTTALGRGHDVFAAVAPFLRGWADPVAKVAVIAEGDVFGRKVRPARPRRKVDPDSMLAHFSELRDGDFVVHEAHGIGKFDGLVTMRVPVTELNKAGVGGYQDNREWITQDFMRLIYAGDDRLMVPVENLDVLTRYKGAEAGHVTLDRLGTGGWEARKDAVKADLMAMAGTILKTAAAREMLSRPSYVTAGAAYDEFCAGFDYALTEDQDRAMTDVENDMAAAAPMDRLVVGDVGFGKTEVALRAAFLAVQSGRQVAVVCPTTLLARQHIDVFTKRFAGTGFSVGGLSRLVKAADAKAVKSGLAKGNIDVVVGTHALLSNDVAFKNLGLVVIDEEQRFGVKHKEKLKEISAELDVLTLTATPIPRTLQMAVGGVRGLSLIATPPVDRQAVQTHLLRWDNETLKSAVLREMGRGGQIYIVAPHVEDLAHLRDSLVTLVPQARVAVAHGQMTEIALESAMVAFYEGSVDILIATTIIESGLDVTRANTLVVYRSDRFGLAQLYQLRGRVGRSGRQAYAYFLLPDGGLGHEAAKRLQILSRLEGLGAGFMLASYDMDLRGFGNLLGKEQSGHIREIGFELYAKMLREAVEERKKKGKGADVASDDILVSSDVALKLGISYLIPESYVPEEAVRLQLYRELARAKTAEDVAYFEEGLKERFGRYPDDVKMLLAVVDLKNRLKRLNVNRVDVGDKGIVVGLENGKFVNPEGLMRFVQDYAGAVTVRPDMSLVIHRRLGAGPARVKGVETLVGELETAAGLAEAAQVA